MNSIRDDLSNLWRNIYKSLDIPMIESVGNNGIYLRGLRIRDLDQVCVLYSQLSHGSKLPFSRRVLYLFMGRKLCVVALTSSETLICAKNYIIAFNFFYFNQRDIDENTVHEGFIGVAPEMQGAGISIALRQHAFSHFSRTSLKGVSSRISVANLPSLNSARKVGLVPIEKYYDEDLCEHRFYLKCDLFQYRH